MVQRPGRTRPGEAAAAFQPGLGALGNVTSETLRAFDEGEMKRIVGAIP